jgi:membrane-associated protease RseP (regulator of RpoE activity)
MRIAALASMVVVAPGASKGCLGSSDDPIEVRWTLPEGPGDRGVRFVGCMDWDLDALPDGQNGLEADAGWASCSLVGWRRDGQLKVETDPIPLEAQTVLQHVIFDLPSGPIGGMGACIETTGYGVHVDCVVPGSPANRAGIVPGDLIVEVDGTPTAHLDTFGFIRRATGVPGTMLSVEVLRDGERYTFDMQRERIR